jgi:hypothetical protein
MGGPTVHSNLRKSNACSRLAARCPSTAAWASPIPKPGPGTNGCKFTKSDSSHRLAIDSNCAEYVQMLLYSEPPLPRMIQSKPTLGNMAFIALLNASKDIALLNADPALRAP